MCGLIVRVTVVPRRTVVGDIDRRFDNLSGSHHQTLMMTSAQVVETSVNVTNNSPSRDYCHSDDDFQLRLSKRRSMSPATVLLGTTVTRTIKPHKRLHCGAVCFQFYPVCNFGNEFTNFRLGTVRSERFNEGFDSVHRSLTEHSIVVSGSLPLCFYFFTYLGTSLFLWYIFYSLLIVCN